MSLQSWLFQSFGTLELVALARLTKEWLMGVKASSIADILHKYEAGLAGVW